MSDNRAIYDIGPLSGGLPVNLAFEAACRSRMVGRENFVATKGGVAQRASRSREILARPTLALGAHPRGEAAKIIPS
jgi:hypothetical protein